MSSDPAAALRRVLALTGLRFPRGLIGREAHRLAAVLREERDDDVQALVRRVAAEMWPQVQASMAAAVERAAERADDVDQDAFAMVLEWARSRDGDNPLALTLAFQAGNDLAAVLGRASSRVEAVEQAPADRRAVVAARAAGLIAVDLLDLDPDDFELEIAAYVEADETVEALRSLARNTGDEEVRAWAREALLELDLPVRGSGLAAIRDFASGEIPQDPGDDVVWVATIQSLAEQGIAIVLASNE
jgi:hypothetical protein